MVSCPSAAPVEAEEADIQSSRIVLKAISVMFENQSQKASYYGVKTLCAVLAVYSLRGTRGAKLYALASAAMHLCRVESQAGTTNQQHLCAYTP